MPCTIRMIVQEYVWKVSNMSNRAVENVAVQKFTVYDTTVIIHSHTCSIDLCGMLFLFHVSSTYRNNLYDPTRLIPLKGLIIYMHECLQVRYIVIIIVLSFLAVYI